MLGSIIGSVINAGAGLLGSALAPKPNYKAAARDAFKGEFNARMGAAEKYGISKLIMAGAPSAGGHPVQVGNPVGEALANMGADLGNAINRHMTEQQRAAQQLALEKAASENELVKAQTRNINMRTIREATPPRPPNMAGVPTPLPKPIVEPPRTTSHLQWGGKDLVMPPGYSDTATATNVGGESMDWTWGPALQYQMYRYNFPYMDHWTYMDMARRLYLDAMGNGAIRSTGRDTYVPLDRRRAYRGY